MWQFVCLVFATPHTLHVAVFLVLVLRNAGCKNPTLATLLSEFDIDPWTSGDLLGKPHVAALASPAHATELYDGRALMFYVVG